jgi:hypothetical protein
MSNNNISTTIKIMAILSIFMVALFYTMSEIRTKNVNLDNKSITLMNSLNVSYTTYQYNNTLSLATTTPLTVNGSTEGIDPFYRQQAEDATSVSNFGDTIVKIYNFPSLFLLIFGVDNNVILQAFNAVVVLFLTFMVALQTYKALRTGEVDS